MGRLRTLGRRGFLIGSATVLGGVAFGTYLAKKPHDNPLADGLEDGEVAFNPFVKITGDRIILIAPHTDVGQGVQSAQVALLAEELDVELNQVEISFGHPDAAYYNTALAADLAPFMPFDDSFTARTVRGNLAVGGKILGVMGTGGSSSMPDAYEKMRQAGAVARETLKQAASELSGAPVSELRTAKGAVQLPNGAEMPYTELAARAAVIPVVADVPLRDPKEWRLVGKPMQRTDIVAKSTGRQAFGIDMSVEGMVHAAVRINPRLGGEMLGFDATAAKDMRGVDRVLELRGTIWEQADDGTMSSRQGPVGVAVIADNTWRANQAADTITFDWAPSYYPAEMDAHWQAVSDSFTPERLNVAWRDDGDVESALDGADVIEAEYRAPYVAHQPLEPLGALIRADKDGAELWVSHQLPRFAQQKVADILGLDDLEKVIFHSQFAGGSFGLRLEFANIVIAAKIARQMPGVPIKLTFSREEDFTHDLPRQIGISRSVGTAKDGQVHAWSIDTATPSTSASQGMRLGFPAAGPDAQIVAGIWNMPYAIPHLRVRGYKVPELAPVSSWRSVGASSAGFFSEGFMDELCHAAGADPLEERLRLTTNDVHRRVLMAVGDMSNWGRDLGPGRGRGVAMVESFGVPCAEVVEVTDTGAGIRIDKVFVAADVGRVIDPVNFENQVQGGVVWGLGHAINCEITFSDGMVEQTNYHAHEAMRMYQCPEIVVKGLENAEHIRGIGEPPVPPAAPALANAIFAATGQRLREMPFNKFMDFV